MEDYPHEIEERDGEIEGESEGEGHITLNFGSHDIDLEKGEGGEREGEREGEGEKEGEGEGEVGEEEEEERRGGEGKPDIKVYSTPWRRRMGVISLLSVVVVLAVVFVGFVGVVLTGGEKEVSSSKPKNLIFVLADGMSPDSLTFAREMSHFNSKDPSPSLPLDKYLVGHARTFSADMVITDSAAGAVAYSCRRLTNNGVIGATPDGKACATMLEAAKSEGYLTGAVTNTRVTHASPASFTAHVANRWQEQDIAKQQTYNFTKSLDLLMGGGRGEFTNREDGEDLTKVLEENGIQVITTPGELQEIDSLPVVGLFAESHIDYEIDRVRNNPREQPSLTDMVSKTLQLFEKDGRPFILFIESGRIDMAAHSNDPGSHYWEMNEYMKTVEALENFVSVVPETTVFFTSDHATGGISTGRRYNNGTYPEYIWFPDVILRQKQSMDQITTRLLNGEDLQDIYLQETGINLEKDHPKEYEALSILTPQKKHNYLSMLAEPLNSDGMIGWTTIGHTGVDINIYLMGWKGGEGWGIGGVMQNYVIGEQLVKGMGLETAMEQVEEGFGGWEIELGGEDVEPTRRGICHDDED